MPHVVFVPHPFSFLPPFHAPSLSLSLSPSSSTSEVSTRQLPCLRATCPLTRLLDQDQRLYLGGAISGWRGRGSSCSPTVGINYNRAAQLDSARRRATPSGAFDAARSPGSDILPEAVPVMGGALFPGLIGEPRRRHCFRRGMLRNAARARFTPTPGVATPLSHATPSPAVARRRPPVSFPICLRRVVLPGFFAPTRLRRPATRVSRQVHLSLRRTSGRPTSRCNQTPAREGRRGREESRDVNVIGNIREGDLPLVSLIHAARLACFHPFFLRTVRRNERKRHAAAFSRVHLRTFASSTSETARENLLNQSTRQHLSSHIPQSHWISDSNACPRH